MGEEIESKILAYLKQTNGDYYYNISNYLKSLQPNISEDRIKSALIRMVSNGIVIELSTIGGGFSNLFGESFLVVNKQKMFEQGDLGPFEEFLKEKGLSEKSIEHDLYMITRVSREGITRENLSERYKNKNIIKQFNRTLDQIEEFYIWLNRPFHHKMIIQV